MSLFPSLLRYNYGVNFVPLHIYSGYSFLSSALMPQKIVGLAKKAGFYGVGLCDYETMTGFPEFRHLLDREEMLGIYGMDVRVDGELLSLFVKEEQGYLNLIRINLEASKGSLTLDCVKKLSEGLIAVLPCEYSSLRQTYRQDPDKIVPYLARFSDGFKEFYLGFPYLPEEPSFLSFLRSFCEKYPYDHLAYPHILYAKKDEAIALEIVRAIKDKQTLTIKKKEGNNHFLSESELTAYYTHAELDATIFLAKSCRFELLKKRGGLLHFPNDLGLTSEEYLHKLSYEGLERKNPGFDQTYRDRLEYELGVINQMGYANYFLIVADYVNYAKTHGILVGPGRGSGAGSLVSYALDIVTPDPIAHDLMFERFLNPERQSMPDIDVDFADIKRDQVVSYLIDKYGESRVARIVTMQTILAKEAIRDVGRVFNYQERQIDLLAKTCAPDSKLSLRDNYRRNKPFRDLIDSDQYYLEIVSLASKIEGLPRQAGMHAAGIVLNDAPLEEAIPVHEDPSIGYVASYEMTYLEEQGFLKMDLLGIRNLTIIEDCLRKIEEGGGPHLEYAEIPYEDKKAIDLIASGQTMGLFQLEGGGMKRAIRELEPESFDDVVALLALFRPGPMANIPSYGRRKRGQERISYPSPRIERILKPTYGIIVYQEQITQIVQAMAGYTYGQADLFRRAISKKDAIKLRMLEGDFMAACLKNGVEEKEAKEVYSLIYEFANYGFNKAHALSYAVLTCQMAYLKAYYPNEFYAAVLDNGLGGRFGETISEMKRRHITLATPDINGSGDEFLVRNGVLCVPFSMIRGLQGSFVRDLLDERRIHGDFSDIFDFAKRMRPYGLNVQTLVKLIDAGCFDGMDPNRTSLRESSPTIIQYAEMFSLDNGQGTLFDFAIPTPVLSSTPHHKEESLEAEKEVLGLMISGSPLTIYEDRLSKLGYTPLGEISEEKGSFLTCGAIKSVRVITTKRGKRMAFIGLYDDTAEADFTLFEEVYDASYILLQKERVVLVTGKKDDRREDTYIADRIEAI